MVLKSYKVAGVITPMNKNCWDQRLPCYVFDLLSFVTKMLFSDYADLKLNMAEVCMKMHHEIARQPVPRCL